jgi:hypothetical protein
LPRILRNDLERGLSCDGKLSAGVIRQPIRADESRIPSSAETCQRQAPQLSGTCVPGDFSGDAWRWKCLSGRGVKDRGGYTNGRLNLCIKTRLFSA